MPQVTVTINGHPYAVACDVGEEDRIQALARVVDAKVESFVQLAPRAGEARLLVLAAIMLADELAEAKDALGRRGGARHDDGDDPALAEGIDRLARRIEAVAQRLESAQM
ncbi:MAG TPA: cell division protein ZapA [Stellaceae bacterium]|nr:cell division protein ZapA [Stellaceae bacterium]